MHDGAGEGTAELGAVADLSDRHDRVRHGRALGVKDGGFRLNDVHQALM